MGRSNRSGEDAQGLLEFAILVPILLLFFLGTIDFARFMFYQTALNNAARTGAEMATNQVLSGPCAQPCSTTYINDFVLQATVCEAKPQMTLSPQISCTACQTTAAICTGNNLDPCASVYYGGSPPTCNACGQDVCVARYSSSSCSPGPGSWASPPNNSPADSQCVRVVVGYNFTPVTFFISQFLPTQRCWVGDTTAHTICAQAAGRQI